MLTTESTTIGYRHSNYSKSFSYFFLFLLVGEVCGKMRCNKRKYVGYERNIEHKIRFSSINLNFLGQIISTSEFKRYFEMILMNVSVQKAEGGDLREGERCGSV